LRLANVEGAEMLSREQLKTVMGGSGSGGGTGSGNCTSSCWRYPATIDEEKMLLGSVTVSNCDTEASACTSDYPDADDATCSCG